MIPVRFLIRLFCHFLPGMSILAGQSPGLQVTALSREVFVYTTWKDVGGAPFPSNSLYVLTDSGAILIDTPWDTNQCRPLADHIRRHHGMEIALVIATHFHDDRTGGFPFFRRWGIPTWSSAHTHALGVERGEATAAFVFERDTVFRVGGRVIEVFDPGAGHTADNIVVWLPGDRILFGGCLVKSVENEGLGHIADADLTAWPAAIRRLQDRYPRPAWVVPGHQGWSRRQKALKHTLKLLERESR